MSWGSVLVAIVPAGLSGATLTGHNLTL